MHPLVDALFAILALLLHSSFCTFIILFMHSLLLHHLFCTFITLCMHSSLSCLYYCTVLYSSCCTCTFITLFMFWSTVYLVFTIALLLFCMHHLVYTYCTRLYYCFTHFVHSLALYICMSRYIVFTTAFILFQARLCHNEFTVFDTALCNLHSYLVFPNEFISLQHSSWIQPSRIHLNPNQLCIKSFCISSFFGFVQTYFAISRAVGVRFFHVFISLDSVFH